MLPPAESFAGNLVIADIGIPQAVIRGLDGPWLEILTKDSMRSLIEPRSQESNKGDYGHVLVVGWIARQDRRGGAVGDGRAPLRRGPRHHRDARVGGGRRSPRWAAST